jgi:hypothetical protein
MSNYEVSPQDVFASAEKYGMKNVLDLNFAKLRFADTKGNLTHYLPVLFRRVDGKTLKLNFDAHFLLASSAELGKFASETTKYLTMSLRRVTAEELANSDYGPKTMKSAEEQAVENQRSAARIEKFVKLNNDACRALDIIEESYVALCEKVKGMTKAELKFSILKSSQWKNGSQVPVITFKQSSYKDKETDEDVKMEVPITRVRLDFDLSSRLIGSRQWDAKAAGKNGKAGAYVMKPCVFDLKKSKKAGGGKSVEAKVLENGKSMPLTCENAKTFITKLSLVKGVLALGELTSSGQGLSISWTFQMMHVLHHKPLSGNNLITADEVNELCEGLSDTDEEIEEVPPARANTPELPKTLTQDLSGSELGSDEEYEEEELSADNDDVYVPEDITV